MISGWILLMDLCKAVDISVNWFLSRSDGMDYESKKKSTV